MTEQAQPAGKFYDEFGVNIHLAQTSGPYGNFSMTLSQLQSLGIKHFRDGIPPGQASLCSQNQQLGSAGLRGTYIVPALATRADIRTIATCAGSAALDTLEGPNEWDQNHPSGDNNAGAEVIQTMHTIYDAVREENDPTFNNVAIIGPAFVYSTSYPAVGDLSAYEDYGNMHDYWNGRNPGTPGYGDNAYGSIPWNINNSKPASQSRPIIATETGWGTSPQPSGPNNLPEYAVGLYAARLYFEHFNAGVPQTYIYELYDEPSLSSYGNYGLIRGDGTAQPHWAYYSIRNLISLLKEPYRASTSATLSYSLSGSLTNINHTLLQKSDGSLWLSLWQEVASVDPNTAQYNTVTPQSVTVTLQTPAKTATLYQTLMTTNSPSAQQLDPTQPMTLSIKDEVTLLRLTY